MFVHCSLYYIPYCLGERLATKIPQKNPYLDPLMTMWALDDPNGIYTRYIFVLSFNQIKLYLTSLLIRREVMALLFLLEEKIWASKKANK